MELTLVDDALEANDGEESSGDGGGGDGEQDEESQQASSVASTFPLQKEVSASDGAIVHHCHDGGRRGGRW